MTPPPAGTGNRLLQEQSPYLQQHAFNPVDWYPWGEEALTRARTENRPILLSIGYSTCHWCHVMEHDTFENLDAARVMNELFVNIKVDREEYPDLDTIYMQASQALTGYGGWPLNVWLTPDLTPFYTGGYMPPHAQGSHPGFIALCQMIESQFRQQRDRIEEIGARVRESLQTRPDALESGLPAGFLTTVINNCRATFDTTFGGFGRAPKFPPAMLLTLLIRHARLSGSSAAMGMIEQTLRAMAEGGIYDQIGGGFCRYSTDAQWLVPHFEKMLYDNALLARAYTECWQLTGNPFYRRIACETLDYVMRDMTHPEGGFYSAEDADSMPPEPGASRHKEEGAFYTFSPAEFREALSPELPVALLEQYWDVTQHGNFEGKSILHVRMPLAEFAQAQGLNPSDFAASIAQAQAALLVYRDRRERPHLDDKILTSWNGLMIGTFAAAGIAFSEPRYVEAARRAAGFVRANLMDATGGLRRRWRNAEARFDGTLEDYTFLAQGLLDLYEATLDPRDLLLARDLAERLVTDFADAENGFFLTAADATELLIRPKDLFDNASPSGNSIAATVCARMHALTGESRWRTLAEGAIGAAGDYVLRAPTAFAWLLQAWQYLQAPPVEIVIAGSPAGQGTHAMLGEVRSRYLPHKALLIVDAAITSQFPLAADRPQREGQATAYVCREMACQSPVSDPVALGQQLDALLPG